MRRPVFFALLWVVAWSGCSLLNRPDRSRIDPTDGAVHDAGMDSAMDGGPDARKAEPEICGNNIDDDLDGSKDCQDADCSYQPECCEMGQGTSVLHESWLRNDDTFGERWRAVPSGEPYPDREEVGSESRVVGFGADPYAAPAGMVTEACVPLALGLHIKTRLTARGAKQSDCLEGKVFASVGLTAARDADPGERIAADLSVDLTGCGDLSVRIAGQSVGVTSTVTAGSPVPIDIAVAPGIDNNGEAYLAVTVSVQRGDGSYRDLVTKRPFLSQSSLVRDAGSCAAIPGLYIDVEGQGTQVEVSPMTAKTLECVNPSQFESALGELALLDADVMGAQTWAGGGVAAPSLFREAPADSEHVWNVLFDGTNDRRELGRVLPLGFALGHAVSDDGVAWSSTESVGQPVPKAGTNPPSCATAPGACTQGPALREPSVLVVSGNEQYVAYARELLNGGSPVHDVYGIDVRTFDVDDTVEVNGTFSPKSKPTLSPSDVSGCKSLRDPSLAPAQPGLPTIKHWLFFTCVPSAGRTSIRAVGLGGTSGLKWLGDPSVPVFASTKLGSYAAGGVSAPEVLAEVNHDTGDVVYRMWFLAQDTRHAETSVGLAQWSPSGDEAPAFTEFPGNPVLTPAAVALAGPACGGVCDITGTTVTRLGDQLYFLLAQTVNRTNDVDYRLVPLKQPWRSPWPEQ